MQAPARRMLVNVRVLIDRQKGKSAYLSATPADGIIAAICSNGIFGTSVPNAALDKNTPFLVTGETSDPRVNEYTLY
jgi:hypothetical protein